MNLREQLTDALAEIELSIVAVNQMAIDHDIDPYAMMDRQGRHYLAPLLVAKAQILQALSVQLPGASPVGVEEKVDEGPEVGDKFPLNIQLPDGKRLMRTEISNGVGAYIMKPASPMRFYKGEDGTWSVADDGGWYPGTYDTAWIAYLKATREGH